MSFIRNTMMHTIHNQATISNLRRHSSQSRPVVAPKLLSVNMVAAHPPPQEVRNHSVRISPRTQSGPGFIDQGLQQRPRLVPLGTLQKEGWKGFTQERKH